MINSVTSINKNSLLKKENYRNKPSIRSQSSFLKEYQSPDQDFNCWKLTESRAIHNHLYKDYYKSIRNTNTNKTKISDFQYISQIGQGGYGTVYLCSKNSGEIMAVKKMNKRILFMQNEIVHVKTEKELMEKSRSEWLVKLYHAFQDEEHIYFAMVKFFFFKNRNMCQGEILEIS